MKHIIAPLAAAIGLSLALSAHAQTANAPTGLTPEHFKQLDRNSNGGVSRAEYEQFMRESFQKLDKDGNKKLSPNEAAAVISPEQFAAVDHNKDGEISLDEFIEHVMRDFERHDYDKDGELRP